MFVVLALLAFVNFSSAADEEINCDQYKEDFKDDAKCKALVSGKPDDSKTKVYQKCLCSEKCVKEAISKLPAGDEKTAWEKVCPEKKPGGLSTTTWIIIGVSAGVVLLAIGGAVWYFLA